MLQVSQSECGLVACATLMHILGGGPSLRSLRIRYEPGRDGMSIRQLSQLLRENGFPPTVLRVQEHGYREVATPYIAYWKNSHYLTVEKVGRRRVVVLDPASGRRRMTHEEFQESFSGFIVTASAADETRSFERESSPWGVVTPFIRSRPQMAAGLIVLALLTSGATIALPQLASGAITRLIQGAELSGSLILLLGILLGFVLIGLVNTIVSVSAAIAVGRDISVTTFRHMLDLPFKYFAVRARGDLLYRLHATQQLEQLLTSDLARGVSALLVVIAASTTMILMSPALGLTAVAIIAVMLVGLAYARRQSAQWSDAEAQHESTANSIQVDSITTISLVKSTGLENDSVDTWLRSYDEALNWRRRRSYLDGAVQTVVGFLQSFAPLVLTVMAMAGLLGPTMQPGDALAFQMLSAAFFAQTTVIAQLATRIGQASAAVTRLEDVLRTPADQTFAKGDKKTVGRRVVLSNVSYGYSNLAEPVLRDISLTADKGCKIAIVGPSGSGKSTLAKLVVGLVSPWGGEISFDGSPIGSHKRESFRDQVIYVEQEPALRNTSIRDNIAWGRDWLSDSDIITAAKNAGIHDGIVAMPMGYKTQIVQNGTNLSGGERQRVALARALVVEPRVIVLDESTSALDRPIERHVMESLRRSSATRIVIAHRLETIRDSDQIYVLDAGKVIGNGTHESLLDECELYSRMYRKEREADTRLGKAELND